MKMCLFFKWRNNACQVVFLKLKLCSKYGTIEKEKPPNWDFWRDILLKIWFVCPLLCVSENINLCHNKYLLFRDVEFLSVAYRHLLTRHEKILPAAAPTSSAEMSLGGMIHGWQSEPGQDILTRSWKETQISLYKHKKEPCTRPLLLTHHNADARTTVGVPGTDVGGKLLCPQPVYVWAYQSASVLGDVLQHDLLPQHDGPLWSGYRIQPHAGEPL